MKHEGLDNNFPLPLFPALSSFLLTLPHKKLSIEGKIKTIYQKRILPVPNFVEQTETMSQSILK